MKTCQLHCLIQLCHPQRLQTLRVKELQHTSPGQTPFIQLFSYHSGASDRKPLRESPLPGSDLHIYGHAMTEGPRHHGECLFRAWMRRLKEVYTH